MGSDDSGGWVWMEHDDSLNVELLGLEVKLSLRKTISVGVLLAHPGQDEAEMMKSNTEATKAFGEFLDFLGTQVETAGFSGYAGGCSKSLMDNITIYYAS